MSSAERRFRQLQDQIAELLDKASHGSYRQRAQHLIKARPLVDELNRLSAHDSNSPPPRTLKQAYKDLASGKLR